MSFHPKDSKSEPCLYVSNAVELLEIFGIFVCRTNLVDLNLSFEISTIKHSKTKSPQKLINHLPKKLLKAGTV